MKVVELFNLKENEFLVSPCVTVHGRCLTEATCISVQHPQLPTLSFPVHEKHFKATMVLVPGLNQLQWSVGNKTQSVNCYYTPLTQNKPIHLCLIVAKDSPFKFDSPKSQIAKEGQPSLQLAVKKLRVAARLMQAYTNEQMLRNGFGQRCFNWVEEYTWDTLFRSKEQMRSTVKVHVITTDKTTREIQDYDVAQQNSKGKNTGALYGWALDALKKYGGPFTAREKPVQAACIYLDSHWDGNLILGHAALGGGDGDINLAIFGSHGIYSWPTCMEDITDYFMDDTRASTKEVANDCNECGTHWECLTVTLGAFMHEVGHSLGSPHQINGVMLRDYTRLNRSFLTKEAFSTRTNSYGAQSPIFPKDECTWHRLDLLRFLYHPAFQRELDFTDPTFHRPSKNGSFDIGRPNFTPMGNNIARFTSSTGIYLLEVVTEDLARGYIEYLPKSLQGTGPQHEVIVSLEDLLNLLPQNHREKHGHEFNIRVLACNSPDLFIESFPSKLKLETISMERFGFPPNTKAVKSSLVGGVNRGNEIDLVPFDVRDIVAVRVYHGMALDGLRFFMKDKKTPTTREQPKIPPRTYMNNLKHSFQNKLKIDNNNSSSQIDNLTSVLFGKQTKDYTDCLLEPGEIITGFNLRCGGWVDAIQITTNYGRITDMFGKKDGGHLDQLIPPDGQFILGVYGRVGQWVDAFGIAYGNL